MEYDINRPWASLDDWQKEYISESPEQDCFLLTGRQVGKTTAMSIKAVELCGHGFKKGEFVLICSITEKQAYHMLAKALAYATEKYPKMISKGKDRPTMHKLLFKNGTGIFCYAAGETGEGLRGFTIKKLMIDEGSRMKDEFFTAVTPMLSVVHGSMDIASTPCGKQGYFYDCSKDPNFKSFYVSGEDCPRHTKEFLDKEKKRMTKLEYAQEYLAVFLDELKQFFNTALIASVMKPREMFVNYVHHPGPNFLGVDVGRMGGGETVLYSVKRVSKEKVVYMDMWLSDKKKIPQTIEWIKFADKKWNYRKIYIDDGGLGVGVFDPLLQDTQTKRKVVAINNAARSIEPDENRRKKILKEDLYFNLLRLMESGQIELANDAETVLSLQSIQYEESDEGIKIFGKYTHITEALIRAAWCMKDKSLNIWIR